MQLVARLAGGGGDLLIAELLPSIAQSVVLTVSICADVAFNYHMDILKVTYLTYILTIE